MNGSTLVINKEVFNSVKFAKINAAEDVNFCKDCLQKGIKIYSTSKYNHVYIRRSSNNKHTWKIRDDEFIKKYCTVIGPIKNYIEYTST
ncbi:hypothetical protein L21TH_0548 [Caldisalinibacter kiritimatiensis]|uniref:Uncharacterized protein n=1 Tax=Caldisalinibacter kiritimatiensis TaxID=1304284 RepID=R1AXM1_9FIRM|nr:hypothetical protein L21TH_0548 [Caldisalinibacter kiritimatiensis]